MYGASRFAMLRPMRILLPLLALVAASLRDRAGRPAATFANPVIDSDFPDPAILRAKDGFYYVYATQTERDGKWINLQVARSRDLVAWEHLGDALPPSRAGRAGPRISGRRTSPSMAAAIISIIRPSPTRP